MNENIIKVTFFQKLGEGDAHQPLPDSQVEICPDCGGIGSHCCLPMFGIGPILRPVCMTCKGSGIKSVTNIQKGSLRVRVLAPYGALLAESVITFD